MRYKQNVAVSERDDEFGKNSRSARTETKKETVCADLVHCGGVGSIAKDTYTRTCDAETGATCLCFR